MQRNNIKCTLKAICTPLTHTPKRKPNKVVGHFSVHFIYVSPSENIIAPFSASVENDRCETMGPFIEFLLLMTFHQWAHWNMLPRQFSTKEKSETKTMNKHISARIAYLQNKRKGVRFDKSSSQANHQLFMPYVRITFVHRFFVVAFSVSLFLYNYCIRRAVFMMNFNLMTLDLHKSVMNVVQTFLAWLRLSLLLLQVVYPKSHCSSPNPPAKYLIRNIWLSIKLSA